MINISKMASKMAAREHGGSVEESQTPKREVGGSIPTSALLCSWARHIHSPKSTCNTMEAVGPSRHAKLFTGT